MGNHQLSPHHDETPDEIQKKKNQIRFQQFDFIKEIEGSIELEYQILSPYLEQNQFYELRKAIHKKTTLIRLLCIVNKYKIRSTERESLEKQINRLKRIDDPGLLKIYELFKDSHRFFIVLEYSSGYSLAKVLQKQGYFEQKSACSVMWQLLTLLSHCHKKGVVHGDLKLEKITYTSKEQETLKVLDFSFSRIFRIENILEQCQSRAFLGAPETLEGIMSAKADIWSCGAILYALLSGEPLIIGASKDLLLQKFKYFNLRFKERRFRYVSSEVKDFLSSILKVDPKERPTAQELLNLPWFSKFKVIQEVSPHVLRRCMLELYSFKPSSKLLEATWIFFVNALISFEEKQLIQSVFMRLDLQSKGELDEDDLIRGFEELYDRKRAKECAKRALMKLTKSTFSFSQFVTYCANRYFLITELNLKKIFCIFDEDGSGQISVAELRDTLGNSKEVAEDVWLQLMREADSNSDGKISFVEFKQMITSLVKGEDRNYAIEQ